ncbi:MAG: hypothetical protein ABR583_05170 [Gaiellaceae bacterium]
MGRRLGLVCALTAVALVAAQAAAAKEGANLTTYPLMGTEAGSPWNAQFEAFSHGDATVAPAVVIRSAAGRTVRFPATRTGGGDGSSAPATYAADVFFPAAGIWTYGVQLRPGDRVEWLADDAVSIAPGPQSAGPITDGFELPLWPFLVGAVLLAAAAGAFVARRQVRGRLAVLR